MENFIKIIDWLLRTNPQFKADHYTTSTYLWGEYIQVEDVPEYQDLSPKERKKVCKEIINDLIYQLS